MVAIALVPLQQRRWISRIVDTLPLTWDWMFFDRLPTGTAA
jgi:hypothetical protein